MTQGVKKGETKLTDEERKAIRKKYDQSEKGNSIKKKAAKKYHSSEKGKATVKEYQQSEKGNRATRLKILRYYSKLHSNSDIPCCRCCGLNSHVKFLDVDHIQGRYDMDSIPELVKLGYSSKRTVMGLTPWLVKNNYLKDLQTEYFQILCKNCNVTKGLYGKCPMENKPH